MPLNMNRDVFITCAVTGAGDTVISTLAAAIAGEGWRPAAELAMADDDPLAPPDRPGRATTHHLWRR